MGRGCSKNFKRLADESSLEKWKRRCVQLELEFCNATDCIGANSNLGVWLSKVENTT